MAGFGGLGGLGGFDFGNILGAIGHSLLVSPREAPLSGLPAGIQAANARSEQGTKTQAMILALTKAGMDPVTAATLARDPTAAALAISTDNATKTRVMATDALKSVDSLVPPDPGGATPPAGGAPPGIPQRVGGLGGLGGFAPGGTSGTEGGGRDIAANPTAKTIYDGVIQRGGTPALAAAVVGNFGAESAFRTGAEGDHGLGGVKGPTAFGWGQWRLERADALRQLAAAAGKDWKDPEVQLDHLFAEFQGGDAGAAKAFQAIQSGNLSPEQAAEVFARHFERPSAKALASSMGDRVGGARSAMAAFGGARPTGAPTQVADASGRVPIPAVTSAPIGAPTATGAPAGTGSSSPNLDPGGFFRLKMAAQSNPDTPVTQLLGQNDLTNGASTLFNKDGSPLTARAAYDKLMGSASPQGQPAPGAQPPPAMASADDLPRGQVAASGGKIPVPLGDIKPPMEKPNVADNTTTMRTWARENFKRGLKLTIAGGAMGEGGKGHVEAGKAAMDLAKEHLKPTEIEKVLEAAGVKPGTPEAQSYLLGSIDKRPDQVKIAETAYPGQPNRMREALRNSIQDNRPEAVRLGQAAQDTPGLVTSGLEVEARRKQGEAAATTTGTKTAEAAQVAPAGMDRAQQALSAVQKLRTHPGRNWATGTIGSQFAIPGTQQADFVALFDQAKSQSFLQAFESLRGGGAITEMVGAKATAAINRLSRALTKEGFDEALKDYEDVIRRGMERLQKTGGSSGDAGSGARPAAVSTPFGTIRQVR